MPASISKVGMDAAAKSKYVVANNSFRHEVKTNPSDRITVEIGDTKQPDFKPQFKFMRWGNEVNFSMRAAEHPNAYTETEGEIIKYITPDYEVHQYDKPDASENGGFEFEWYLPTKPDSNVLKATIQTKGLSFYQQPELTPEEKKQGRYRPDNVVGSYAVYHSTKRNNVSGGQEYKTGKAFHIYRPEAIDSKGQRAWCDLLIDEVTGESTVTIPPKFYDDASYPMTVDPTFGYTSVGASEDSLPALYITTHGPYSPAVTDGVASVSVYISSSTTEGTPTTLGIYPDLVGIPDVQVPVCATAGGATAAGSAWLTLAVSGAPSVSSASSYHLVTHHSTNTIYFKYDTATQTLRYKNAISYVAGSIPNPCPALSPGGSSNAYSIYATTGVASGHQKNVLSLGVG